MTAPPPPLMPHNFSLALAPRVFFRPREVFLSLARARPTGAAVFWRYALWVGIVPPLAAAFGSAAFGWRLGIGEPILFSARVAAFIGGAYFAALLVGYFAASYLTKWMAATYGAEDSFGLAAGLVAVVGTPLAAGGVLHLYPHAGLNLLALIPAVVWSAYLLYAGLPIAFGLDSARGMLMASAVLSCLFVAAVGLLGLTMILWVSGLGPDIGFEWRSAVFG